MLKSGRSFITEQLDACARQEEATRLAQREDGHKLVTVDSWGEFTAELQRGMCAHIDLRNKPMVQQ